MTLILNLKLYSPITARCSLFIPPENRKHMVFLCFQGYKKETPGSNGLTLSLRFVAAPREVLLP